MRKLTWMLVGALAILLTGCPDAKPKYPACDGDKDCKKGEKCINKKCTKFCTEDAECGPGKKCVDGGCEPIPGWCSQDGDCDDGMICENNACVPCKSDDQCGEGGRCIDGGCLRKGQCRTDEDCPEDQDCVNGVCTRGGAVEGGTGDPPCKLESIFFGFDQYTLDDEAKQKLQANAECLSSTPRKVAVVGHTDERGPDEYNIGLADDRAQAVITYLSRLGIDGSRLRKVPKGEGEATGTDESGWAQDRRVEFTWE